MSLRNACPFRVVVAAIAWDSLARRGRHVRASHYHVALPALPIPFTSVTSAIDLPLHSVMPMCATICASVFCWCLGWSPAGITIGVCCGFLLVVVRASSCGAASIASAPVLRKLHACRLRRSDQRCCLLGSFVVVAPRLVTERTRRREHPRDVPGA